MTLWRPRNGAMKALKWVAVVLVVLVAAGLGYSLRN